MKKIFLLFLLILSLNTCSSSKETVYLNDNENDDFTGETTSKL